MSPRFLPFARLIGFAIVLATLLGDAPRAAAQGPRATGPIVGPLMRATASQAAQRLTAPSAAVVQREMPAPARLSSRTSGATQTTIVDRVRQALKATANMPAPIANFGGLGFSPWGSGWPPDPNGDVGPNHYVQTVNTSIGIFAKNGTLLAATTFDDFFDGTGTPCDAHNQGDPVTLYDVLADRWIVADMGGNSRNSGPSYECIAISKTGDPVAGGWWQYALLVDSQMLNDYPKLGVWADGYYLTADIFDGSGTMRYNRVWALNRQAMLGGQAFSPISFNLPCTAECYATLLPGNLKGASPPSGTPNFLGAISEPNVFSLFKFHVDWNNPALSTLTGPVRLTVADFAMPCYAANVFSCVPARGGEAIDGLGDRLMMQLQYRHIGGIQSLWATHTVAESASLGTPTGIRWYEIRDPNGTAKVYQQGTLQPDSDYRWMPSLAVDRSGNMAIGYSVSSSTRYPAIRYAGRLVTDPLGVLGQGEVSLVEGTGSQRNGYNRWGDYTAMTVDPVDDCTFWYTNEYYASTGRNWLTRIGSFRFPSCGAVPAPVAAGQTPSPKPGRVEDAYEPDESCEQGHVITAPELHNFSNSKDQDWVRFPTRATWTYHIKADPRANFPTEPHLDLTVRGRLLASNDHYFGNTAEIWWWNQEGDGTACVRVTELKSRAEAGNSEYTLSVEGYKDRP